jgi:hypothetical protein
MAVAHLSGNPTYRELRQFADRLLGSWTINFRLSITRVRALSANWFARACPRARELRANADTHFLSGFSMVDTESFSFSNFANRSRTCSASFASGTNSK